MTPAAAEGLPLPDALMDMIARDDEGPAALICRLHEDADHSASWSGWLVDGMPAL